MEGVPSLQLAESLFEDAPCWQVDGLPYAEQDRNVDIFEMVQALGLDETMVVPDADVAAGLDSPESELTAGAKPAQTGKKKDKKKMDRIRARNREAQARYRQKAKGHAVELRSNISDIQHALTSGQQRRLQLQSDNVQLTQRCSNSVAALDAILSVSGLIPATHVAPNPPAQGSPGAQHVNQSQQPVPQSSQQDLAHIPEGLAPVATHRSSSQATTPSSHQTSRSLIFSPTVPPTPPPLTSFQHHKPVSPILVHCPDYPSNIKPPDAHQFEPNISDNASGAPSGSGIVNLQQLVDEFRTSEAAEGGCGVSDIAWFVQTQINVMGADVSEQHSKPGAFQAGNETLSFSTKFSSGPCFASFVLMYLHLSTDIVATAAAIDVLDGAAPEDIGTGPNSGGFTDTTSRTLSGELNQIHTNSQQKRRRDSSGNAISTSPETTRSKPLKSTAQMMAIAGLTDAQIDSCNVRCGVGALVPLRSAVRNLFRDSVARFCGIVPVESLMLCFERAISTIDQMLVGFTTGNQGTSPPSSQAQTPSCSTDDHFSFGAPTSQFNAPQTSDNNAGTSNACQGINSQQPMPFEHFNLLKCSGLRHIIEAASGATRGSWEEQYTLESGLHTVGAILAVRAELMSLLGTIPDVIAETRQSEATPTKLQLLQYNSRLCFDFGFSQMVGTMDSPKIVYKMIMDAFQPFLGQYYEVDNMHGQLYKTVRPNNTVRARLANFWMSQEQRKRKLDSDMDTARTLLASLPSRVPLPLNFLSLLNTLSSPPSTCMHAAAASAEMSGRKLGCTTNTPVSSMFGPSGCFNSGTQHSIYELDACFQRPSSHLNSANASVGFGSVDTDGLWDSASFAKQYSSAYSSQISLCTAPQRHQSVQQACQTEVRFMGQHAQDMAIAEKALRALRHAMDNEKDVQVDMLNAELPGVLMEYEKLQRAMADHFVRQMMPPDFMELCQIAATQQNRFNLFHEPFT